MQYNQASPFEFDGKSMEAETTTRGRVVIEQILASEERKNQKESGCEKQSGIEVGKLTC